jgi:hypothetical protein
MQADQVIWLAVAVVAVFAVLFLIRLFRVPQDDRLAFLSMDAEQRRTPSADGPRIRSKKDLIAFLQQETGERDLAVLLADAAEAIGKDGYVDVRQGGSGNRYAVEYQERPAELDRLKAALKSATSNDERDQLETQIAWLGGLDQRSCREVSAELDGLKAALKRATSEDERDRLERQIAWLAGGICILWVNVASSADYQRQRGLIQESFRKLKSACG